LKKEETLALIPGENVLKATEKRGFQSGKFLRVSERCRKKGVLWAVFSRF